VLHDGCRPVSLEASPCSPEPQEKTQRKTQRSVKSGEEGAEKQEEHQEKTGGSIKDAEASVVGHG
jgi:hypothetical protein